MKKLIFMTLMAVNAIFVNAQTAVQSSKIFDNVYVGAEVGAATPLTFVNVFPLNTTVRIGVSNHFYTFFCGEIEGTAWFRSNYG